LGYYGALATLRFEGATFRAYPQDHLPRHVHGFIGETELIVDLRTDGNVSVANRVDAIRPGNAKRADLRRILELAAEHFEELVSLWEKMHG
jgi:hypothetical protein